MPDFLSHFSIKLNQNDPPTGMMGDLAEIVVETNLHLPAMSIIRLHDREMKWVDSNELAVGTPVEIAAKAREASRPTTVFKGEITAHEPEFDQAAPSFQVRCYDRAHRLHRGRRRRSFLDQTDGDIAGTLAGEAGLTPQVGSTSVTYDYLFQNNLTNWEFLQERARRIGFDCFVDDQTLHFEEAGRSQGQVDLEWGTNSLRTFRPRLSTCGQVKEVVVRGWDAKNKQEIIATATQGQGQPQIGESESGGQTSEGAFQPDAQMTIVDRPVNSVDEATAFAQAVADDLSGDYIRAEGEGDGDPRLQAGTTANITAVGDRFSGEYLVTRAVHSYAAEERYTTRFSVTGRRALSVGTLLTSEADVRDSRLPGVVVGLVTDLGDPDEIGRVKVKFPWLEDHAESTWARIAAPMAGPERGFYWLPEVNDEVLVAFEHNDINFPYVIGALWNGQDKPPLPSSEVIGADGHVNQRVIRSRSGHLVVLDDTDGDEKIIIRDKTESNEIVIDSASNSMSIKVEGDFTVEATGKITLKSTQDLTLESSANSKVKTRGNLEVEATGNSTLKGTQLTLEGTSKGTLKAPMVSVEGSAQTEIKGGAMTEIKGAVVKIN
jgi:uncharacterized protein involved in type VI secretion and phage assembly